MWPVDRHIFETKAPAYGCHLQFQPRVRSGKRVEDRNTQPVVQPTSATDDLDRSKFSQLVSWLLDFRNTDHCQPIPGRPQ